MKAKYNYSSSKKAILVSELVIWMFFVVIYYLTLNRAKDYLKDIFTIDAIATIGVLFNVLVTLFFLFQAIYNGVIYLKSFRNEWLEIDNTERYILYKTNLNGEPKEVKANYDDIYLIKKYKAKYVNLYYYEVFFTENAIIRKIVISISLASNIEKKIKKKIKLIQDEDVFCSMLPDLDSWIGNR